MRQQQRSLRVGMAVILCALVIRFPQLLGYGIRLLTIPPTIAFLTYAGTGRDVKLSPEGEILPEVIPDGFLFYAPESPAPVPEGPVIPSFPHPDRLAIYDTCHLKPDLSDLLQRPLQWNLQAEVPTVLIYHTHTTESYTRTGKEYKETALYRTLNEEYNVLSIGDLVTELLEAGGIHVVHDRKFHDYPNYNSSYAHSRKEARRLLQENPGIVLALDIHRDASGSGRNQMRTAANVGGQTSAQLMIVVGSNAGRLRHDHWEENLAVACKLQAQLETQTPGIIRPICLRAQRFNQDLLPGALLIEVGSAGNTHKEALLAARQLAQAILALSHGTLPCPTEDSTVSAAAPDEGPLSPA